MTFAEYFSSLEDGLIYELYNEAISLKQGHYSQLTGWLLDLINNIKEEYPDLSSLNVIVNMIHQEIARRWAKNYIKTIMNV